MQQLYIMLFKVIRCVAAVVDWQMSWGQFIIILFFPGHYSVSLLFPNVIDL